MVFLWIASKIRACYNKDTESLHAGKGLFRRKYQEIRIRLPRQGGTDRLKDPVCKLFPLFENLIYTGTKKHAVHRGCPLHN